MCRGFDSRQGRHTTYSYPNSWLVIGAQRIGRFDLARPALAFLRKFISPANGGIFTEAAYPSAGDGMQDIVVTSRA